MTAEPIPAQPALPDEVRRSAADALVSSGMLGLIVSTAERGQLDAGAVARAAATEVFAAAVPLVVARAREQALADAIKAIEARANDPEPLCSGDHDIRYCGECDSLDDGMFLAADVVRSLSQPGSNK